MCLFLFDFEGGVCDLIVLIPDHCLSTQSYKTDLDLFDYFGRKKRRLATEKRHLFLNRLISFSFAGSSTI